MGGWTAVSNHPGWQVNWGGVADVAHAYAYMRAFKESAAVRKYQGGTHYANGKTYDDYQVFGAVKTVDWKRDSFAALKNQYNNQTLPALMQKIQRNPTEGLNWIKAVRRATLNLRGERNNLFSQASDHARTVDASLGIAIKSLQMARDIGFSTIAVLGVPAGGTLAFVAAGVSASGASLGKWQDTGNVGSAALAGVGSLFMCGYGAAASALQGAHKAAAVVGGVFCDATFEMGGQVLEGATTKATMVAGILKVLTGGVNARIDGKFGEQIDDIYGAITSSAKKIGWNEARARVGVETAKKAVDQAPNAIQATFERMLGVKRAGPDTSSADAANYITSHVLRRG